MHVTAAQEGQGFRIAADDAPAAVVALGDSPLFGRAGVGVTEILTADEQRARSSQTYFRSAVGVRLRVVGVEEAGTSSEQVTTITQHDAVSGLRVRTVLTRPEGTSAVRFQQRITNTGKTPIVLTAVASAAIGIGHAESDLDELVLATARSEWLAENRWAETPLRTVLPRLSLDLHGQDGRGHFGITSHGAWSAGEQVPGGLLLDVEGGEALGWQFETNAGWHADLSQTLSGGVLTLLGPTDLQHQFAHELVPGESFDAVPVVLATSAQGRDGVVAELTAYRRWLRRARAADEGLPIVYNDFMNTLMGQPSTEKLLPLVAEAAAVGVEIFCIDAGWFAEPELGDWWATVGCWAEARNRFSGGLREVIDAIHGQGMRSGLWLEPEIVGAESPAAATLPDEAFFQRFGRRVREHDRFHLDFRHPAARAHLDEVVDRLVADYGVTYLKLDHNINPGAGTDWRATSPGDGLLQHTRAFRQWLIDVQDRHPGLLLENCSSGAMRMDYSLLEVTHLQSTSDQQDLRLYPPVAAAAPVMILPEQCGNWAYPAAGMTREETIFTLVSGLSGRLYLSGFLNELDAGQRMLVAEAVALHARLREHLDEAVPFWPLGLPDWEAPVVCLGLRLPAQDLLFIWDRNDGATDIVIPGIGGTAMQLFPATPPDWELRGQGDMLAVRTTPGASARVLTITGRRWG